MILPCGRAFLAVDGRTRACARPAEHQGVCSGVPLSMDVGAPHPITDEEIAASDAEAILRVMQQLVDRVTA